MKANETPERIYFGEADKSVLDLFSTKEHDDEVEYVRTDVFIEKVIGWIDYNNRNGGCNFDGWEKDFKKYMEK